MSPMSPRLLRPRASRGFFGGNLSAASIYDAALSMKNGSAVTPGSGGTLTINGESLGSYDYCIRAGETLSSFTASDWFTATEDTRSAWCVVKGDLTIDSGVTFTPTKRKLFTVLVVTGNLTVNGTITMTARGANHSGAGNSGGATTARAIRIIDGTYSGVADPQVPADGGALLVGATSPANNQSGTTGNSGSAGGTGGGGSGFITSGAGGYQAGSGAAGTAFSGGAGAAPMWVFRTYGAATTAASGGQASGGAGGGAASWGGVELGGGAGNPGGNGLNSSNTVGAPFGGDGTGGVLIVIVLGELRGSGVIAANGAQGGSAANAGGAGSGGGSVTVLRKTDTSSITPAANGGAGGSAVYAGAAGGAGTARKLTL